MAETPKPAPPKPVSTPNKPLAYSPSHQAGSVKVPAGDVRGDTFLTHDEIKSLAGDLAPGEIGWVKLDGEGTPSGAAVRDIIGLQKPEEPYARVIGSPKVVADEIVTPSGAPVTKFMNPEPTLWDAGMLARNPIPPQPPEDKQYRHTVGAPVINQPVAT